MSGINALVDMQEALSAAASAAAGALATHPELGLAVGVLSVGLWRLRATPPAAGLPAPSEAAPPSLGVGLGGQSSAADPLAERAALAVSTPGGGE